MLMTMMRARNITIDDGDDDDDNDNDDDDDDASWTNRSPPLFFYSWPNSLPLAKTMLTMMMVTKILFGMVFHNNT